MIPETRYARGADGAHIAYQVLGDGPIDLVLVDQWFSHMDGQWDVAPAAEFRRRLASFSRLIMFDKRGIGLSDPVPIAQLPTLEEWIEDLRTVLDAVGSERAALIANLGGGLMSIVCAATYPDRISSLILADSFARIRQAPDYPEGEPDDVVEDRLARIDTEHGRGLLVRLFAPSLANDTRLLDAWARYERQSASPGTAVAMIRMLYGADVRSVLPVVRVPTLVIQHTDVRAHQPALGLYLAEHIPAAKLVKLPGPDNLIWAGDPDAVIAEIQEFITGTRPVIEPDRVLATVMFTDIVDSTARAARLGDRRWRALLDDHDRLIRAELARRGGREVKRTGDGFLMTFDGPARAVRAADAIRQAVAGLGMEVRAGVHTGEIELVDSDVAGVAVHIGARVAALAGAGEILASSTVRDLVAGSSITFLDRGSHVLKGVPGRWRLFAVENAGS
ncbi:MAG TPA: adenylate/guanylate cyclase domain-containing protein [Acidimicrobiia bacterium]|nr:adenylate/guanylate cyclase domain-containing protein [Acidimicrobiia bacterium]